MTSRRRQSVFYRFWRSISGKKTSISTKPTELHSAPQNVRTEHIDLPDIESLSTLSTTISAIDDVKQYQFKQKEPETMWRRASVPLPLVKLSSPEMLPQTPESLPRLASPSITSLDTTAATFGHSMMVFPRESFRTPMPKARSRIPKSRRRVQIMESITKPLGEDNRFYESPDKQGEVKVNIAKQPVASPLMETSTFQTPLRPLIISPRKRPTSPFTPSATRSGRSMETATRAASSPTVTQRTRDFASPKRTPAPGPPPSMPLPPTPPIKLKGSRARLSAARSPSRIPVLKRPQNVSKTDTAS